MKTIFSLRRTFTAGFCGLVLVGLLTGGASGAGGRTDFATTARASGAANSAPAASPQRQFFCSNETLSGRYALRGDGSVRFGGPEAPLLPFAVVSLLTMDGEGNLTNQVTRSIGGQISSGIDTGTYSVNPDCTGTMTIGALSFNMVVSELRGASQGREFYLIATTPGGVVTGTAKQIQ